MLYSKNIMTKKEAWLIYQASIQNEKNILFSLFYI